MTESSFDRKLFRKMVIDRKFFSKNGHLNESFFFRKMPFDYSTESPFNRTPFDRKFILPKKVNWLKTKFIKRSFDRKYLEYGHLAENLT
jgi:hypothetical protein